VDTIFSLLPTFPIGVANIHQRLVQRRFLVGLEHAEFTREAGKIIGDLNYVHPFREGNGRTQLQYLKRLAVRAGHDIDLTLEARSLARGIPGPRYEL